MRAIILAAGRGSRMNSLTESLPKCRTILHGKELIQWQMESLKQGGVDQVAVVRGYLAETFEFDIPYFENARWAESNMVRSLLAARDWLLNDQCIVSYSDIVYSADVVGKLTQSTSGTAITYDPNWRKLWERRFTDPLSDAETFKLSGGKLTEIGKRTSSFEDIHGQYMGLVKFKPEGWKSVDDFLHQLSDESIDSMDMTTLLQKMIEIGIEIQSVPISDRWFEVDTESDLKLYEMEEDPLF
jgi:L-glutamine-phosphate cytidylyltransferase